MRIYPDINQDEPHVWAAAHILAVVPRLHLHAYAYKRVTRRGITNPGIGAQFTKCACTGTHTNIHTYTHRTGARHALMLRHD